MEAETDQWVHWGAFAFRLQWDNHHSFSVAPHGPIGKKYRELLRSHRIPHRLRQSLFSIRFKHGSYDFFQLLEMAAKKEIRLELTPETPLPTLVAQHICDQ